jgi:hypothetical protein
MSENIAHDDRGLLSSIPTCVLVGELKRRKGVISYLCGDNQTYSIDITNGDLLGGDSGKGPARILVVID